MGPPGAAAGRPLAAAALACVTPLLWYHGADGQAHAAEGLLALLLFGAAARVKARPGLLPALLLVAAFGLAGSVRPTVSLLLAPLLVWVFWGRPARAWALAVVTGGAAVAAWAVPLVHLAGGWDLYTRASRALVGDLFAANYSVLGARARPALVWRNVQAVLWSLAFAAVPLVAWVRGGLAGWRRPWLAVVAGSAIFFALFVYLAEAGYLAAVAALACLAPATWPARPSTGLRARLAAALALACGIVLFGPGTVPFADGGGLLAPTLTRVAAVDDWQRAYRATVCDATAGEPALLVTDNPVTTHTRPLPLRCPGLLVGVLLERHPLNPAFEGWLVFDRLSLLSLPTAVPLEPGPPARAALRRPVARVLVAPDASEELVETILGAASCEPLAGGPDGRSPRWPDVPVVFPAGCLPTLRAGGNALDLPGASMGQDPGSAQAPR